VLGLGSFSFWNQGSCWWGHPPILDLNNFWPFVIVSTCVSCTLQAPYWSINDLDLTFHLKTFTPSHSLICCFRKCMMFIEFYILSCYWPSANAWFTTQPILPICFCSLLHFFPLVLHTQLGFSHLSILGLLHCVCTTHWFNMCNVLLCVHNIDYMGNIIKIQWIYRECTWNHIWNIL
jgi:hypothetical protein